MALRDNLEARPGSRCSGEQICNVLFPSAWGSYEVALVWCHAERLRFSSPFYSADGFENVTTVHP